jgi:quinol-cytochrome oxidoreductase complex cytochrome b subunit
MLMWHIVLLPIGVVIIAGLHVLLVRRHGIVPPFDESGADPSPDLATAAAAEEPA